MDAVLGTGTALGYFTEATLGVYGWTLEKYLPGLLDQLDELDAACRAIGALTITYEHFRTSLL